MKSPAQLFSLEICEAFKNTFFAEHLRWSWSLSFKTFYVYELNTNQHEYNTSQQESTQLRHESTWINTSTTRVN